MKKALVLLILCLGCSKSSDPGSSTIPTPSTGATTGGTSGGTTTPSMGTASEVPSYFKLIYGASKITSDGTYVTIESSGAQTIKAFIMPQTVAYTKTFLAKLLMG